VEPSAKRHWRRLSESTGLTDVCGDGRRETLEIGLGHDICGVGNVEGAPGSSSILGVSASRALRSPPVDDSNLQDDVRVVPAFASAHDMTSTT